MVSLSKRSLENLESPQYLPFLYSFVPAPPRIMWLPYLFLTLFFVPIDSGLDQAFSTFSTF